MFICDLLGSMGAWLDQAGAFNIPWLGDLLASLLGWVWELLNCGAD
jgi:hypothetical protein